MQKTRRVPLNVVGGTDPWYAMGLRFKCTQCGNCCGGAPGYVWITPQDMGRIAAFLDLPLERFQRTYVRQVGDAFSLTEKKNFDCVFLKRENGKAMCGIYPVRPVQCRTWPFWNLNLKSPDAWADAATRCPGMADAEAPRARLEHIEKCRTDPGSPL